MGNSLEKTSDTTSTNRSSIYGSVEEIINTTLNQLNTNKLYDCSIDPLDFNNIPSYSPTEKSSISSIVNLSRNICTCIGKEREKEFENIYEFLKFEIEGKLFISRLKEINRVLNEGLKQIQSEVEDLEKNLLEDKHFEERKAQLKKFMLALNNWNIEKSHYWSSISYKLLEFIKSHTDPSAFNKPQNLEVYVTALCLYAFAKLRSERRSREEPINKQIQRVMDDACDLIRSSLQNVTYHNADASFKREQTPYYGVGDLPGYGPFDIFCGLHQGLKSATIQKFACEDNQIISFVNEESQKNDSFKFAFNKLQVLLPNVFYKHDKENNVNVNVEVRIPFQYNLDSDKSLWDYRSETWKFKSNEHYVYISPLVYKVICEISAIYAAINDDEEMNVVEHQNYSKLIKIFERKLVYSAEINADFEKFIEIQGPWKDCSVCTV
jgi:hypothetical protein